jgi:hypothetical protein
MAASLSRPAARLRHGGCGHLLAGLAPSVMSNSSGRRSFVATYHAALNGFPRTVSSSSLHAASKALGHRETEIQCVGRTLHAHRSIIGCDRSTGASGRRRAGKHVRLFHQASAGRAPLFRRHKAGEIGPGRSRLDNMTVLCFDSFATNRERGSRLQKAAIMLRAAACLACVLA